VHFNEKPPGKLEPTKRATLKVWGEREHPVKVGRGGD